MMRPGGQDTPAASSRETQRDLEEDQGVTFEREP